MCGASVDAQVHVLVGDGAALGRQLAVQFGGALKVLVSVALSQTSASADLVDSSGASYSLRLDMSQSSVRLGDLLSGHFCCLSWLAGLVQGVCVFEARPLLDVVSTSLDGFDGILEAVQVEQCDNLDMLGLDVSGRFGQSCVCCAEDLVVVRYRRLPEQR